MARTALGEASLPPLSSTSTSLLDASDKPKISASQWKSCRANSFAQVLPFSLSLLVLKEIAHTLRGYSVLLAALCTVSESSSCFLLPPAHLQMFQALNWIPKVRS